MNDELDKTSTGKKIITARIPIAWENEIKRISAKYFTSESEFYRSAVISAIRMFRLLDID